MMGVIDQMLKPSAVGVDEVNPNRAKITLEPLERGFGHTLGNTSRATAIMGIVGNRWRSTESPSAPQTNKRCMKTERAIAVRPITASGVTFGRAPTKNAKKIPATRYPTAQINGALTFSSN